MEVLKARVIKNYEGVKWCPSPGAPGLLRPCSAQQELYALTSGLRQPSSSCDYANADPEHLLTSEQLILACWVPLSTGCSHLNMLQLLLSKTFNLWHTFGTADRCGVCILSNQALHLPVQLQSCWHTVQGGRCCSPQLARACRDGGMRVQAQAGEWGEKGTQQGTER